MTAPAPASEPGANSRPEASRLLRNLALAAGVFVVGALVLALTSGGDDSVEPLRIGPAYGAEVDAYVEERHGRLDTLDGPVRAVVSFADYVDAEAAVDVVGTGVARWLVAAPGGTPRVTDNVETWREEFAAAARAEADEIEALIPTVDDAEFEAQYRSDVDRAREIAEALDAGDPVVFAVVVTAPAGDLRRLVGVAGVRLVDPIDDGAQGGVSGLRPEETLVAGEPPERPLG